MRVIAVIDQRAVIKKILHHLGLWNGTSLLAPARSPPADADEPWTREPCADVDPMPDYENVLINSPSPVRRMKRCRLRQPMGCARCGHSSPPNLHWGGCNRSDSHANVPTVVCHKCVTGSKFPMQKFPSLQTRKTSNEQT